MEAIDSFQNAISDSFICLALSWHFKVPLWTTRILVILLNLPIMIVGLQGYNIASLYLIANMTTACTTFPLILGLVPALDRRLNSRGVFSGSALGLGLVILYGVWDTGSLVSGLKKYFFESYDAIAFLLGALGSTLGSLLCCQFSSSHPSESLPREDETPSSSSSNEELLLHKNETSD